MNTVKSGGSGAEGEHRASLVARWRSLSAWISGELTRMRKDRLDRGFLATSHGNNYDRPASDRPAAPGEPIDDGSER